MPARLDLSLWDMAQKVLFDMAEKAKPDLDDPKFWLAIADEYRSIADKIEGTASRFPILVVAANYCSIAQCPEGSQDRLIMKARSAVDLRGQLLELDGKTHLSGLLDIPLIVPFAVLRPALD